jgi:Uma2 family endonuclease
MKPIRDRLKDAVPRKVPPLHNGDRLSQEEFHRRYEASPEDVKAELIGGVVFMASPMRRPHGTYHPKISLVLALYEEATPGTEIGDNLTAILGDDSEPQPDLLLRIHRESGGQSHYDEDDYLVGAPELVVEVAHSTRSIDLGSKRRDYRLAGVQEYVVFCAQEKELHWFHFLSGRRLRPDRQGVWKSRVFPGLWLDGPALAELNTTRLRATLQLGIESDEHVEFVRRLRAARDQGKGGAKRS